MTEAIFGLIGVLVGGLLQGTASWVMERRRESWAARRAGRLLTRDLARCRFLIRYAIDNPLPWHFIGHQINTSLRDWPEHASVLAGTLSDNDAWNDIARAVDSLQRMEQRSAASPDENTTPDDRERFATVAEELCTASFTTSLIGIAGIQSTPRRWFRRLNPFRRRRLEPLAAELVEYSYRAEGDEPPHDDEPADPSFGRLTGTAPPGGCVTNVVSTTK